MLSLSQSPSPQIRAISDQAMGEDFNLAQEGNTENSNEEFSTDEIPLQAVFNFANSKTQKSKANYLAGVFLSRFLGIHKTKDLYKNPVPNGIIYVCVCDISLCVCMRVCVYACILA